MNTDDLENEYLNIISPDIFVNEFKDDKEFTEWLCLGTTEDLEHCLLAFIEAEMYHHCTIIKTVINIRNCQ